MADTPEALAELAQELHTTHPRSSLSWLECSHPECQTARELISRANALWGTE